MVEYNQAGWGSVYNLLNYGYLHWQTSRRNIYL